MDSLQRSIILNIGPSCFVACVGCYNNFAASLKRRNSVSREAITDFAKTAYDRGYSKITIGGGDPLSRPDIIALLEAIKSLGFSINLDTVGTPLLGDAKAKFYGTQVVQKVSAKALAAVVDNVGIPLDGSNQEIASTFRRGRDTLFADQLRIIKLLGDAGAKVCLNTVVSQFNQTDLPKLLQTISLLPIAKWQLFQFMPIGVLGSRNRDKLEISHESFLASIEEVKKFARDLKPKLLIEAKSVADRKNRYLLVNDAGMAWIPTGNGEERIDLANIAENRGKRVFEIIERLDRAQDISPPKGLGLIPSLSSRDSTVSILRP